MKRSTRLVITGTGLILALSGLAICKVTSWLGPSGAASAVYKSQAANSPTQSDALQRIKTARASLIRALANKDRRRTPETVAEVSKAFAEYKAAMTSRIDTLIALLKALDARIPRTAPVPEVDSAAHRKAVARSFKDSGVRDEYIAGARELEELRNDLLELTAKVRLAAQAASCPPPTISNTLGGTSPDFPSTTGTQTGQLTRDGNASTCEEIPLRRIQKRSRGGAAALAVKACPGLEDTAGQRTFDQYEFFNSACGSVCVTVTLSIDTQAAAGDVRTSQTGSDLFAVAYLTSFNPSNLCENYLADPGSSPLSGEPVTFSFDVPAQETLVLIVQEVTAGEGAGTPYSLSISDLCRPCQIGCGEDFFANTDPGLCTATVNYPVPITCGDCGELICTPAPGSVFSLGVTPVTCAIDQGPSCTFNVFVEDQQPPTIACPANIATVAAGVGCSSATSKVVAYSAPTATDNCGETSAVVCEPASGSVFPVGTTTVVCSSTDTAGNTGICSFTVSVFNASLQDESNPNNVVLINTLSGQYSFCCNGTVFTGTGSVIIRGCIFTLQHNPSGRRVLINIDFSVKKGTASLQSPVGINRCTIADRDTSNNTHTCP